MPSTGEPSVSVLWGGGCGCDACSLTRLPPLHAVRSPAASIECSYTYSTGARCRVTSDDEGEPCWLHAQAERPSDHPLHTAEEVTTRVAAGRAGGHARVMPATDYLSTYTCSSCTEEHSTPFDAADCCPPPIHATLPPTSCGLTTDQRLTADAASALIRYSEHSANERMRLGEPGERTTFVPLVGEPERAPLPFPSARAIRNRYDGVCRYCSGVVLADAGLVERNVSTSRWEARHTSASDCDAAAVAVTSRPAAGFTVTLEPGYYQPEDRIVYRVMQSRSGYRYIRQIIGRRLVPLSRPSMQAAQATILQTGERESVVAYGINTGRCGCCGRSLTDPVSIRNHVGPVCARRRGWVMV